MRASKKKSPTRPGPRIFQLIAALFPRLVQRQRESEQRLMAASRGERAANPNVLVRASPRLEAVFRREKALQLGPLRREFNAAGELIERIRARRLQPGDVAGLRAGVGLSQARFAKALGISVRTLQKWEQGRATPQGSGLALLRLAARHPQIIRELGEQPW